LVGGGHREEGDDGTAALYNANEVIKIGQRVAGHPGIEPWIRIASPCFRRKKSNPGARNRQFKTIAEQIVFKTVYFFVPMFKVNKVKAKTKFPK
jgi:hypothetical protein